MLQSNLLSKSAKIIHGFTTKSEGNLHLTSATLTKVKAFFRKISQRELTLIGFEQIHASNIARVGNDYQDQIIAQCDGGVTLSRDKILAVNTADCLPILFFDPEIPLISAVHAGWKGLISDIVAKAIRLMLALKAKPDNIIMVIGPHIGSCCYRISERRAKKFIAKFGNDNQIIYNSEGNLHLDLAKVAYQQALSLQLKKENLEVMLTCTSCQTDMFYSFRREGENLLGEMLSFIAIVDQ